VTVGEDCKIQNNVSIYEGVTLEHGVFCGRVACSPCDQSALDGVPQVRVQANAREVRRDNRANATIVCGHVIGAYAFIAAGRW
jgi:UDP-2-acetamido-3-amino-2,3-dideoxy-glucuronate N-acetyltransferase